MIINVEVGETRVVKATDDTTCLMTSGVSTCICLLIKGRVGSVPYLGMMHWDGFSYEFDKNSRQVEKHARQAVDSLIWRLAYSVELEMKNYKHRRDEKPLLESFQIIGGERASKDLSGTELEVQSLIHYSKRFCDKYFKTTDNTYYDSSVYLTSGTQDLDINFRLNDTEVITNGLEEDIDNAYTFRI